MHRFLPIMTDYCWHLPIRQPSAGSVNGAETERAEAGPGTGARGCEGRNNGPSPGLRWVRTNPTRRQAGLAREPSRQAMMYPYRGWQASSAPARTRRRVGGPSFPRAPSRYRDRRPTDRVWPPPLSTRITRHHPTRSPHHGRARRPGANDRQLSPAGERLAAIHRRRRAAWIRET